MRAPAHAGAVVLAAVVLAATVAVVTPASAEPVADAVCAEHVDDPVAVPWRDSGVDATRGGCLHADVSARLGGHALIDTPGFYGTVGGDLTVAARFVESNRLEWGFGLRVVDAVVVQNAVFTVDELGYGPISAHLALGGASVLAGKPLRGAVYARLEAPFTRSRLDGSSGALQLGGAATWRLAPRWRAHGHVAALGWYASSTSGRDGRAAAATSADLGWRPRGWLGLFLGADLQVGWYGWGLDHLAVRSGAHWRVKGLWRVELAAGRPLLGAERTDLGFGLAVRRDLD